MTETPRPVGAQAAIDRSDKAFVDGDVDSSADELITALRQTTPEDRAHLIGTMIQTLTDRAKRG
ncbi:hypothetical protein OG275_38090 (plasmid) [Streptomyces niveus]|uniref:hypothetical protein n=1 Tax=Streptomyces niveus TaxID=193462 RepID=UPI002E36D4EB|nr:hypothetical protein [Streptomyces niveus]